MRTTPAGAVGSPRSDRGSIALVALASALGAVAAGTHATAVSTSDVVAAACLGAGGVLAAALAARWAWATASLLTLLATSGGWLVLPALAFAGVVAEPRVDPGRRRLLGAAIGAAVVQALVRLPEGRFDANALLSALAIGCLVVSGWSGLGPPHRARLRRLSLVAGGLVALAVAGLGVSVLLARDDVGTGIERAQDGLAAARNGNGESAADLLDGAARSFGTAHQDLGSWWAKPALVVPIVGQHARALEVLAAQGSDLAATAAISARSARIDDLQVVDGQLDLDRVRAMAAPLASARAALGLASDGIGRAKSPWLIGPVANQVGEFEQAVDKATSDAATAAAAVAVLPDLLGGSGRREYFVAFGTPAETRELGGFMGSYALLQADEGKISLATTGRVRDLNREVTSPLTDPGTFPDPYLSLLPQRFWHNITGTADFPTVAEAVHQRWRPPSGGSIDGVIYMDPAALAAFLNLTGPINLPDYDEPLTADTAADFLLRQQYVAFAGDTRHEFLIDAAETVFDELTSGELPAPRDVADALGPAVQGRRLLLHSFHPDEQALFERLQIDGTLPAVDGDFLSVRSSNRGLNKIDAFMQRTVVYDVTVDPLRRSVRSTVTVTIKNDASAAGLPYAVRGNRLGKPSGTNSTTLAIYTPLRLVDVTQDGRSISRSANPVYDRSRYSVLLDVPAKREVTVVFELEGQLDPRVGYHLDIVPQPLVNDDALSVEVRGSAGWVPWGTPRLTTDLRRTESLDVVFLPGF